MTATRTEDRLVAALQARADQVRPEDLAPFVAPEPGRFRPRWGVYALAAAAIVAVVAARSPWTRCAARPRRRRDRRRRR